MNSSNQRLRLLSVPLILLSGAWGQPSVPPTLVESLQTEVLSVSKDAETLFRSDATVTIITHEQLRRYGVRRLSEALNLVPGVGMRRLNNQEFSQRARGAYNRLDRSIALLVDGRLTVSDAVTGRDWSIMDIPIEEIDRLEVVRGPAGLLWDVNSAAGMVNVITRHAASDENVLVTGSFTTEGDVRAYFAKSFEFSEDLLMRAFVERTKVQANDETTGVVPFDGGQRWRGGFTGSWSPDVQNVLRYGLSAFQSEVDQEQFFFLPEPPFREAARGVNGEDHLHAHVTWEHFFDAETASRVVLFGSSYKLETPFLAFDSTLADLEIGFRHRIGRHHLNFGAGVRHEDGDIGAEQVTFMEDNLNETALKGFFLDQIDLVEDRWRLGIGAQFDFDELAGNEIQPTARLLYTPSENLSYWLAVTRAINEQGVRLSNTDLLVNAEPSTTVNGVTTPTVLTRLQGAHPRAEVQLSFEAGARALLAERLLLDGAVFVNDLDHMPSLAPAGISQRDGVLENTLRRDSEYGGISSGFELSAEYVFSPSLRFSGNYAYMDFDLDPESGSEDQLLDFDLDLTPRHECMAHLQFDPCERYHFDAWLNYSDDIGGEGVGSITDLRLRGSWRVRSGLSVDLLGINLLSDGDLEFDGSRSYPVAAASPNQRMLYLYSTFRF